MDAEFLSSLNPQQRAAATAPHDRPLLIVAGAGTGKTNTLAHRVAHLIYSGVSPSRILLMTFSRRAAHEMTKRAQGILKAAKPVTSNQQPATPPFSGTFHSVANRLLRVHARAIGLTEAFTVVDRGDAEDLLNTVRSDLALDKADVRFPRKETCYAIYSRCVNAQEPIEKALKERFPWVGGFDEQLKGLFKAYVARKQEQNVLDYDDLLLYWFHLMQEETLAADVRGRFDAVLVDEYQDTNALQAEILRGLCPGGRGLTVVGDDAQAIYSFRAATVRNILDFPAKFPGSQMLKLEQNYRSVQSILDATNAVIALCPKRHHKSLFSTRPSAQKPRLVTCLDEEQQSDYIIKRILEHREAGIDLRRQAVLFRAAHHSDALEVELARRNIPFVKFGGLKFLEAAHVKDVLAFLRLAENPRDSVSAMRVLMLLDGIGPTHARKAIDYLQQHQGELSSWMDFVPPAAASGQWSNFVDVIVKLSTGPLGLADQISLIRDFYGPILTRCYDQGEIRLRDIEQLEQIAGNFASRSQLLSELTLDPPNSTQDLAGPPLREEDYLILSTIHSAKGCEWDAVYVLHAADGNIPSDLATGSDEEIEEERRLFYVGLTRAKDFLEVLFPLKYYHKKRSGSDRHSYAQLTRFLPSTVLPFFERVKLDRPQQVEAQIDAAVTDLKKKVAGMWA